MLGTGIHSRSMHMLLHCKNIALGDRVKFRRFLTRKYVRIHPWSFPFLPWPIVRCVSSKPANSFSFSFLPLTSTETSLLWKTASVPDSISSAKSWDTTPKQVSHGVISSYFSFFTCRHGKIIWNEISLWLWIFFKARWELVFHFCITKAKLAYSKVTCLYEPIFCASRFESFCKPVHTISSQGSDFCWFQKSDRVNTVKMTFRHTNP